MTTKQIYSGSILDLYVNQMTLDGQIVQRELIHHHPAVSVLAITPEGKMVFVKQYRAAIDEDLMEIPAGIIDFVQGGFEEPVEAAKRELEEETAYQAGQWESLGDFFVSPGYLDEKIYLFRATELVKVDNPIPADDDEQIELMELSKPEVKELLKANKIKDAKTLLAVQYWLFDEEA
ncbi:NUDIX hydrolase [Aerococcaceae bacterium DSM 111020]|nr:NUDIX hydrolase [Aerococcaceae bacterium DSM 111020]